jgi:hypothetical protein
VPLEEAEDLSFWWSKHEGQFLTVAYLAKAILAYLVVRLREYFLLLTFS